MKDFSTCQWFITFKTFSTRVFQKIYDVITRLPDTNLVAFGLSIFTFIFLSLGKDVINPLIKKKLKIEVPIPFELIAVSVKLVMKLFFSSSSVQQFHFFVICMTITMSKLLNTFPLGM